MELSLVLDPPSAPSLDGKAPGTDPNDNASQAFASLLAALVGGLAPQPTPIAVALPVDTPSVAVASITAPTTTAPVPPTALTLADLAPFSSPSARQGRADGDQKPIAVPAVPLTAAAMAPPMVPVTPVAVATDEPEPEPDPITVVTTAAPAKPAAKVTTHPSARAAAPEPTADVTVVQPFSSPPPPQEGGDRDQNEQRPPVTVTATASASRDAAAVTAKPFVVEAPRVTAPTAPAPTTPAASPVEQVVRAVAPLRRLPDGTHRVVLELHPADLGTVRVELSIDAGTVHLGLHADTEATSHLLHAALPELRSQLDAAGLAAGRLAVDSGGTSRRGGQGLWQTATDRPRRRAATTSAPDAVDDIDVNAARLVAAGHVDVLL